MSDISCSIVLYRHKPEEVTALIASILACKLVDKLYLVDNSPTDALKTLAGDERLAYIFNNKNIGYGAGHNIALRGALTTTAYHVVLNPDISFTAGTLESIYSFMQAHPEAGLVMPKVLYPNGSLQYTCRLLPAPVDLIFRRFLPSFLIKKRTARYEMHSGYTGIMEAPYMLGCFMFLRVQAIKDVGLFDERFFMYPEDIDLTRRIHRKYKTLFFPGAVVTHGYERGSYKNLKLFCIHMVNIVRYFNKWGWFTDKERKAVNKKIMQQFATK